MLRSSKATTTTSCLWTTSRSKTQKNEVDFYRPLFLFSPKISRKLRAFMLSFFRFIKHTIITRTPLFWMFAFSFFLNNGSTNRSFLSEVFHSHFLLILLFSRHLSPSRENFFFAPFAFKTLPFTPYTFGFLSQKNVLTKRFFLSALTFLSIPKNSFGSLFLRGPFFFFMKTVQ